MIFWRDFREVAVALLMLPLWFYLGYRLSLPWSWYLSVLAMIWGTTFNLIKSERAAAERAATLSSRELAETYEAQVVRALREIDQTLKVVKFAS